MDDFPLAFVLELTKEVGFLGLKSIVAFEVFHFGIYAAYLVASSLAEKDENGLPKSKVPQAVSKVFDRHYTLLCILIGEFLSEHVIPNLGLDGKNTYVRYGSRLTSTVFAFSLEYTHSKYHLDWSSKKNKQDKEGGEDVEYSVVYGILGYESAIERKFYAKRHDEGYFIGLTKCLINKCISTAFGELFDDYYVAQFFIGSVKRINDTYIFGKGFLSENFNALGFVFKVTYSGAARFLSEAIILGLASERSLGTAIATIKPLLEALMLGFFEYAEAEWGWDKMA